MVYFQRLAILFWIFLWCGSISAQQLSQKQLQQIQQLSPAHQSQALQLLDQLTPAQQSQALQLLGSGQVFPEQQSQTRPPEQQSQSRQFPGRVQPDTIATGNISSELQQILFPSPPEGDSRIEEEANEALDVPSLEEEEEEKAIEGQITQFGYDLFSGVPSTFAPTTDIPIPSEYVIGPGDNLHVQLFGKESAQYVLLVTRDGVINFPGLGPISVVGLTFQQMKDELQLRIESQKIGVKVSVTMGNLRSIQIFVLGDVNYPGSYTISSLSTMTNALFVSGGVSTIGTLRDIQLKRSGKIIGRLDLYDLLLKGDTSNDQRLLPGDVIFVPPVGPTVGIAGEVRRPAIYELKHERSVKELLELAGRLTPASYPKASQIERITEKRERTILDVDITSEQGLNSRIQEGDVLRVYSVLERVEDIVLLSGHVERPGGYQWSEGMRLTDIVTSVYELLPKPDLEYAIIRRERTPDRSIEVIPVVLGKALVNPDSAHNIVLMPRDHIFVFGLEQNRTKLLKDLIAQLHKQTRYLEPARVVNIQGHVRYPGTYPLTDGMTIAGLVQAALGVKVKADINYALLVRQHDHGERVGVQSIRLEEELSHQDPAMRVRLEPLDRLIVFRVDSDRSALLKPILDRLEQQATSTEPAQIVAVSGKLRIPGRYPLIEGMRISDLIRAAGGFHESAYAMHAELTRYMVVEGQYRETLHRKIDLKAILAGNEEADIVLMPRDVLMVRQLPEWRDKRIVTVGGEVLFPGQYEVSVGETISGVVRRAGGLTQRAYPLGTVFMREELRRKEQKQLDDLREQLKTDLAISVLQDRQLSGKTIDVSAGVIQSLLSQLQNTKAAGRLVIRMDKALDDNKEYNVELQNGDRLFVPDKPHEVTVIGEVHYPTSHIYDRRYGVDGYINRSGGLTYKADDDRTYVVKVNGEVYSASNGSWLDDDDDISHDIAVGDTIVVPLDIGYMSPLTFWSTITQILYRTGVAAAAWKTVGVF